MLSKSNLKNSVFAIIACILWGSTYPVAKLTYDSLIINSLYVSSIMLLKGIKFTNPIKRTDVMINNDYSDSLNAIASMMGSVSSMTEEGAAAWITYGANVI